MFIQNVANEVIQSIFGLLLRLARFLRKLFPQKKRSDKYHVCLHT